MPFGDTEVEPPATGETEPMPLLMDAEVAFVVVHKSADELPAVIELGFAESVQVGVGGGRTITVAEQVAVCPFVP